MGSLVQKIIFKLKNNRCWLFFVLIIGWIILNFLQSIFSEIHNDEAYYFLYGENLAWGYFDHPPLVGLLIFLSKLFFGGNLSIRFMTILFNAATIILCWKLVDEKLPDSKKVLTFFIISGSMIMLNAYGFITTPDVPFLFFTALFLLSYKKFLEKESWVSVLLLAISMAGLVYSKYHAFLLIGFIGLSNLKLLLRYKFWIAGILALVFLAPHIYWQISMDLPSIKYHVNDRNNGFEWDCFLGYIPNQMVVHNPFTLIIVVYLMYKNKPRDIFERGLYFLIIGFLGFFAILSSYRYVEPHWTIASSIPIIFLVYRHSMQNEKILKFVKKWIAPTLILIFIARIALVSGILPEKFAFNGKEKKSREIESIAGDLPVVFTGSFQRASTYHFFTKKESLLLNAVNSRYTQFDFLQKELKYQGKPVFVCVPMEGKSQQYKIGERIIEGYLAESFQSVNRVVIDFELDKKEFYVGDTLTVKFEIINPSDYDINFQHPEFPVSCRVGYESSLVRRKFDFADCKLNEPIHILPANGKIKRELKTVIPNLSPEKYQFVITLTNPICSARNSPFIPVTIKERG